MRNNVQDIANTAELHVFQTSAFISICRHLLPFIHEGWRKQKNPAKLPLNVLAYICGYLKMEVEQADRCWSILQPVIEREDTLDLQHLIAGTQSTTDSVRRLYSLNIREFVRTQIRRTSLIPNTQPAALTLTVDFDYCPEVDCGKKLVWKPTLSGALLTMKSGRLPISLPSKYCNSESDCQKPGNGRTEGESSLQDSFLL